MAARVSRITPDSPRAGTLGRHKKIQYTRVRERRVQKVPFVARKGVRSHGAMQHSKLTLEFVDTHQRVLRTHKLDEAVTYAMDHQKGGAVQGRLTMNPDNPFAHEKFPTQKTGKLGDKTLSTFHGVVHLLSTAIFLGPSGLIFLRELWRSTSTWHSSFHGKEILSIKQGFCSCSFVSSSGTIATDTPPSGSTPGGLRIFDNPPLHNVITNTIQLGSQPPNLQYQPVSDPNSELYDTLSVVSTAAAVCGDKQQTVAALTSLPIGEVKIQSNLTYPAQV
ncbi:hypothetical protein EDC04DRAFT_2603327 [Pisolithus marmoratus]|nr:hypothetical protein EDC04DRAFT_2603327 [Pisolithus marmoratus]